METIIAFLEQYWGVTLVGTLTVGTLITFIIMNTLTFIQNRTRTTETTQVVAALKAETTSALNLANQYRAMFTQSTERAMAMESVITTLLTATGYIIAASRLSTADKLAVQEQFVHLRDELAALSAPAQIPVVSSTTIAIPAPAPVDVSKPVTEFVQAAANGVVDLVTKYASSTKGV